MSNLNVLILTTGNPRRIRCGDGGVIHRDESYAGDWYQQINSTGTLPIKSD